MKNLMTFIIKSLFFVTVGFATTINIPADYTTIQAGIDAAVDGDTVLVQPGTYVENISYNGKNIVVMSSDGAESTIIDGNQSGIVVEFEGGTDITAELNGFTITNGYSDLNGSITIDSSGCSLKNLIITNNSIVGIKIEFSNQWFGLTDIENILIYENAGGYIPLIPIRMLEM